MELSKKAMITKFYIDGFKSLFEFNISCDSLTCLIGMNNSGKSTILQAFDFLSAIANGNVSKWLDARGWKPRDIRSQLKSRQQIIYIMLTFKLNDNVYLWIIDFIFNRLNCINERIIRIDDSGTETFLLNVKDDFYSLFREEKKYVDFNYNGSILASLKEELLSPELKQIKQFLQSFKSLELLTPSLLRKRARTSEGDLGAGGEKLSAFLYNLSKDKKEYIHKKMRVLFKSFTDYHVKAKRSGWKELWINELFKNSFTLIEASHISDGFLRLLALFSQLQTDYSVLLFDEIEDGINHEVMEYLMDELINAHQQIILTTHSPMILNFLEDDIAKKSVMLVYRDETGKTQACNFFDIPKIKEKLEYMGPGEVFANVNLRELP